MQTEASSQLNETRITAANVDKVLKEKGTCFGCLNTGHLSKSCNHVERQSHPTALRIPLKKKADKAANSENVHLSEAEATVTNTLVSSQATGGQTGAGTNGILQILPFQVKAKKEIRPFRHMPFWTAVQRPRSLLKL